MGISFSFSQIFHHRQDWVTPHLLRDCQQLLHPGILQNLLLIHHHHHQDLLCILLLQMFPCILHLLLQHQIMRTHLTTILVMALLMAQLIQQLLLLQDIHPLHLPLLDGHHHPLLLLPHHLHLHQLNLHPHHRNKFIITFFTLCLY
ncbi:hypothetical protein RhiirC2_519463 [Rhizophagus irregularis]|uniref:Uncharacterized protein n=1 Tax=Rhizophagus irregularis TaxID=588596 RepID=A0A2N1NX94_9GLOM|nr:hypothetical protein RhiirC2_519463 [Rhizophagus irregularis]